MTVRVATVLSARDWEPALVAHARETASVRIVVRAYQPEDIDRRFEDIDVVVAGGEVSWVTPACVSEWRSRGLAVLGVAPAGDSPAATLLQVGGADEVVPDSIDTVALVQAIRFIAPEHPGVRGDAAGSLVAVVAPRGAPGATETAIAYALGAVGHHDTLLIDLDIDAPSIAIRLGLPPRPDLTDVADGVRAHGTIAAETLHRYGRLDVITGSHRDGEPSLRAGLVDGVLRAARSRWSEVVVDIGSSPRMRDLLDHASDVILVVEGSAVGIVRGARLVSDWVGPAPSLILNRVDPSSARGVVDAARQWIGLDPAAVIADRRAVRRAASRSMAPDRRFARTVGALGVRSS
jgi:MinD-like ATPase involved in chromosome partitioning or flagellar assembly